MQGSARTILPRWVARSPAVCLWVERPITGHSASSERRSVISGLGRSASQITAAKDFANMLEVCPGAFINIGNAGAIGSRPVHNPHYGFNDAALPLEQVSSRDWSRKS